MLVKLKRTWFGPDGMRYRANSNGVEIPERLRESLPRDAEVLSKAPPPPEKEKPVALSELGKKLNPPADDAKLIASEDKKK